MSTISFRIKDEELELIQKYVSINKLNLSSFIREAILDKVEDDLKLDEERIEKGLKKAKKEKVYDHNEVWKELGI